MRNLRAAVTALVVVASPLCAQQERPAEAAQDSTPADMMQPPATPDASMAPATAATGAGPALAAGPVPTPLARLTAIVEQQHQYIVMLEKHVAALDAYIQTLRGGRR